MYPVLDSSKMIGLPANDTQGPSSNWDQARLVCRMQSVDAANCYFGMQQGGLRNTPGVGDVGGVQVLKQLPKQGPCRAVQLVVFLDHQQRLHGTYRLRVSCNRRISWYCRSPVKRSGSSASSSGGMPPEQVLLAEPTPLHTTPFRHTVHGRCQQETQRLIDHFREHHPRCRKSQTAPARSASDGPVLRPSGSGAAHPAPHSHSPCRTSPAMSIGS